MNVPPTEFIRVRPEDLRGLVTALFEKADMAGEDARLIADLLVHADLRGVFSHGTRQTPGYVRLLLNGKLNPRPQVRQVSEAPLFGPAPKGILKRTGRSRRQNPSSSTTATAC